ncbi:PIN domain-like protein, partial [Amanita rubescens]
WQVLECVGQERSLQQLSLDDGLKKVPRSDGLLRVGVDARHQVERARFPSSTGENPELHALFYKLTRLLNTCILPVFVFDGVWRPAVKRGRTVLTAPSWTTGDFKQFIEAFGFCWHQAPGEAEAELAYLNRKGMIDVILTEDSDAFVFGGTHVIRTK